MIDFYLNVSKFFGKINAYFYNKHVKALRRKQIKERTR
jgi:hypothetical protein